MNAISTDQLDRLAWEIADHGVASREDEVAAVVRLARGAGVSSTAIDVLADAGAPAVARARAFGLVATALSTGAAASVRQIAA